MECTLPRTLMLEYASTSTSTGWPAVPVNEGDKVNKGQLLVQLSRSQMLIRMGQTKAEVASARAKLEEMRAGTREEEIRIGRTEIRLSQVELNRREDLLKRMVELARIKAVTEQELEQGRAISVGCNSGGMTGVWLVCDC